MASITSRLKEIRSVYNGVVPIFKPSGESSNDIIKFMNYDLNNYIDPTRVKDPRSITRIGFASSLEPFASGVLTLFLGEATKKSPAFSFAKYAYRAKVKFGEQRKDDCIDGPVIGQSSYHHLDRKLILAEAVKYLGITKQEYPTHVFDRLIFDSDQCILDDIEQKKKSKLPQRYPLMFIPDRLVECHNLELVSLILPYAEIFISCSGNFSVRQFFADLSKQLNCHTSLIELERLKEGPFSLEAVTTQIYHLHYEILSQRLSRSKSAEENECLNEYMRKIQQAV